MASPTARDRLVAAAFDLFVRQGFDATTIEQIAGEAGVGRTTFFRNFPAKEDVVFPNHEPILTAVDARLASASADTAGVALYEASGIVLDHYLNEGDAARARYGLTRSIPALRAAEIARQRDYQKVFRNHAQAWGFDDLDAELMANGVVTTHNHVLRRWLRGLTLTPHAELKAGLERIYSHPSVRRHRPSFNAGTDGSHVIILSARDDAETVAATIREALGDTLAV